MAEAKRQVMLIVDPPTAEVGAVYEGRVVNITKFGAFVNILPGTDGLLHISKLGGDRRLDKVEEVLNVGDSVKVLVDDIDPNGKLSLSVVGDLAAAQEGSTSEPVSEATASEPNETDSTDTNDDNSPSAENETSAAREYVSFEEHFSETAKSLYGDMGPEPKDDGRGRRRRRSRR